MFDWEYFGSGADVDSYSLTSVNVVLAKDNMLVLGDGENLCIW